MRIIERLLTAVAVLMLGTLPVTAGEEFGPTPLEPLEGGAGIPKIQVKESRHDWGKVYQGEAVQHTFLIENVGDATLRILGVKAG